MRLRILATWVLAACCTAFALLPNVSTAADGALQPGDHVAVIGDSITEQKQYSVFIEDYLLMCQPAANLRVTQFGWSGETANGFANRMDNAMSRFKSTVATTCYGMNDGGYSPMTPDKAKRYHDAQTQVVEKLKKLGVRFIVVGSPGGVDTDFFRRDANNPNQAAEMSAMYNKTLGELRDIAKQVAQEQGVAFANVLDPMLTTMKAGKAKFGNGYHVGGGDGVHPDANGHLVMAYAFLKGLGCDGNIGTITVDLGANQATATEGHKVVSTKDGTVELESTRYPFCFTGDGKSPNSTRSMLELLPFNDELNRYRLVVKGAQGGKLKVTWGPTSKEFTTEQLATGINLAAEFLDNPFSESFKKVDAQVRHQQHFETALIKELIHSLPRFKTIVPDEAAAIDRIVEGAVAKDKTMFDAAAATVTPVKHTLKIEPVR